MLNMQSFVNFNKSNLEIFVGGCFAKSYYFIMNEAYFY